MRKTSWSNKELEKLCNPENHKIVYDGFDYRWFHRINGKWEIHSIYYFKDYDKPYSLLRYNLAVWSKELTTRRIEKARKVKRRQNRIERISKERTFDNTKKAMEIHSIMPELTNEEIGNILGVSKQMIGRYLKGCISV